MICRKDDLGGTSDSGAPALDAGGAPPPPGDGGLDTQPPTVSITSPAEGATVQPSTQVSVQAQDDQGVARVELKVDGVLLASQNATPYTFAISLQPGTHTLTAVAHDQAGNKAQATVTVTVPGAGPAPATDSGAPAPAPDSGVNPDPGPAGGSGAFGTACSVAADCLSGVCASDPTLAASYCTQPCGPQDWCPPGGTCVASSGNARLCALELGDEAAGCSVAPHRSPRGPMWLLAGLVLLGLRRRR